jgi:hypothetical protein
MINEIKTQSIFDSHWKRSNRKDIKYSQEVQDKFNKEMIKAQIKSINFYYDGMNAVVKKRADKYLAILEERL